jgi:hypothetical protein
MRLVVGLIVFAALVRGLVWAVALPPWQGPDEPGHFTYIQRIATTGTIPAQHHSPPEYYSKSLNVSVVATGYLPSRTHEPLRLLRRGLPGFPAERHDLSQTNHGGLIVWKYPPAYYLLVTPAYMLPFLHTDTARMYAVRVASALIGALAVWLVFLLIAEAGASPLIAVLGTLTYSLLPMVSQASAIVNPDILLMAAFAGLAHSVLVLRRRWERGQALRVALWALLVLLTKPIGGPAALVLIVAALAFRPGPRDARRRVAGTAAVAGSLVVSYIAMTIAATWAFFGTRTALSAARYGVSYFWQFYLPALPFMDPAAFAYHARSGHALPSWSVWLVGTTGHFSWLTITMPSWAYRLTLWSLVAAACVALVACALKPDRGDRAVSALLVAGIGNVILLHLAELLAVLQGTSDLILQGRYLLVVVPLFAAALYQPLSRIGRAGVVTAAALTVVAAVLSIEAMNDVLVFFG